MNTPQHRQHILTVVLEDYFQVGAFKSLIPNDYWPRFETRLKHNTEAALELLARTNSQATFFTCGWIADNHPDVLAEIISHGHEVACQGYFHYTINELDQAAFRRDVRRSREAVENATGMAVEGFRIGRGWLKEQDLWALDVLAELGFKYDSSLCPLGRQFSHNRLSAVPHNHTGPSGVIHEVPISSLRYGPLYLPIGGGNYLRQLPQALSNWGLERWLAQNDAPLVCYFHAWELDHNQPLISAASKLQRIRHYRNLQLMPEKMGAYLKRFDFTSIADYLAITPRQVARRSQATDATVLTGNPVNKPRVPITLVIPCYNEAVTLPYLKKTLDRFAEKSAALFELHYILVDDGSTDHSLEVMQQLFAGNERVRVIEHPSNRGIGAALVTGFRHVETELLAVIDADCTFAPEQLLEMIELLADDVDVVVASPCLAGGIMSNVPWWRAALSRGAMYLYRGVCRHKLTSYTSCFRLYRREAISGLVVNNPGFCGVSEILGRLDLAGSRIVEYPAVLDVRLLGQSKIRILNTVADHLQLVMRLALCRWFGKSMPAGQQWSESD